MHHQPVSINRFQYFCSVLKQKNGSFVKRAKTVGKNTRAVRLIETEEAIKEL
jgi:hypothetical protein